MPYKDRKKGTWRAVIKHKGHRIALKTFKTKKEASSWENMLRRELKRNDSDRQLRVTDLQTLCIKYLDYAERFSKRTYDEKRTLSRRLLTFIEPDNRSPQYTPSTEDVLRLLAVATRQERVFLDCYLHTGARRSEIFRWTWADDINFEKRQIRLGSRKTRDGSMEYVWLPMNTDLYESLWWWWNNRRFKDSPYVFVSDRRGPHYGQQYKYRNHFMKSLCKRAGIKPFGFHALRRYVASVLADTHKVSAKRIQRILRHKSLSTTERYIQNINEDLEDTLELLSTMSVPPNGTPKRKKNQAADA
jgi:integrase